ncbi:PhnD/SsuA/transferrin family substrate-binding protein [Antarcticimicrobium sediminis]|uniref:PhnD/SsuA/transferrin family substrate-binding protein n=1 Tax=Antarcticimicrobium sediminis TaxID=2546227 RepID=UPI0014049780|nr:PhnD/SsuA/transferrin family substrate-binding protein [Antarcticimicrobium sediminis]
MLVLTVIGLFFTPATSCAQDSTQAEAATASDADITTLRIGVLATEGATRMLESWGPTADLLNRAARDQNLPYKFSVIPHTVTSLSQAIEGGQISFALTDPASFVAAEVESRARALLSAARMWEGRTYDMTGALVFTRADSPIRDIRQLEDRKVMAVEPGDFSGWWLAEQEFRKRRMDPRDALSELVFSGGNQREVVYAVQSGLVDAGVVRAGELEELAEQGVIDLTDFAPISATAHEAFPFWVSTSLYPDWVLAALPDVPEPVLGMVINALLTVTVDSPQSKAAGGVLWQAPQNYQSVHELLISLRVRPYEHYMMQAANRIFRTYRMPILGGIALILVSLAFLAYELRRNILLAEDRRNVLQSEVRSKLFYRTAIEEHTVFCMLTQDGRISHVNDRFCRTADRRRKDILHRPLASLLNGRDTDVLMKEIMTSMQVGAPWNGALTILKEDGSTAWVQCSCIPVTGIDDQLSEVAVVATDMTQTRKGISDERFKDSLELIDDQVVVLRPGTLEMLYCNKAAEQRLVRDRMGGTWKGKRVGNFITGKDLETLELRRDALIEGAQRRITWEVMTKSGVPYEISMEYVEPDQDEPRLIAIYRDITERKQAEKAKNEFISTVSHELRTPLTSMKGALGLALSGSIGEMSDPLHKMVSMASTNCDRLVVLINDILDLEKIEAGKMNFTMEPLNMAALVGAAIEANKFYAEKFGVALRCEIDNENGELFTLGDRNRLMQVMDNLMSNAAKFSVQGAEIIVGLRPHRGALRLTVRDFGSGIPKAAQATIFDKFTQADSTDTRSKGGTGLGLSIAKLIVEEHQGALLFVSEEGEGTEFIVDLPRLESEALHPITPQDEAEGTAPEFSEFSSTATPVAALRESASFAALLTQLRESGKTVKVESSHVVASQVIKGVGVLGQSAAPIWLGDQGRTLMAGLSEREILDNRSVAVLAVTPSNETEADETAAPVDMSEDMAGVLATWLAQVAKVHGTGGAVRMLRLDDGAEVDTLPEGTEIVRGGDVSETLTRAEQGGFDLIISGERSGEAGVTVLLPVKGGCLPEDQPIVLIVARNALGVASRGVVSKFARPAGSGRGKARRRVV